MMNNKGQFTLLGILLISIIILNSFAIVHYHNTKGKDVVEKIDLDEFEENFKDEEIKEDFNDFVGEEVEDDENDEEAEVVTEVTYESNQSVTNDEDIPISEEVEENPETEPIVENLILIEARFDELIVGEYIEYEVDVKNIGNETISCWDSVGSYREWPSTETYKRSLDYNPKEFLPGETITFYGKTNYPLNVAERYEFHSQICKDNSKFTKKFLILDTGE